MEPVLEKLQNTQIEILDVIDEICKKNDIKYSLYAGSLLGAIRHNGFIPWDDDLDICMSREDYNKFICVWDESSHDGYILQNKENTRSFTQSFTKIRKDNSTFLQFDFERGRYHTGIFVDIFPLDRIPTDTFKRKIFKWNCMKYQLLTREFVPFEANFIIKLGSNFILKTTSKKKLMERRKKVLNKIVRYNEDTSIPLVGIETVQNLQAEFPNNLFKEYTMHKFGEKEYMIYSYWKDMLEVLYGDYMKLPPEEERTWKHHPIILDFENNYEDIKSNKVEKCND